MERYIFVYFQQTDVLNSTGQWRNNFLLESSTALFRTRVGTRAELLIHELLL